MIDQWHILGAGAMGSLLACKLQRAGIPACLLYRAGAAPPQPAGQILLCESGDTTAIPVAWQALDRLRGENVSGLFITTKANQAVAAFEGIAAHVIPGAPIVLLHNGMGVYEELASRYPQHEFFCGTTTEGAYFNDDGQLVHAGIGETRIGRADTPTPADWFRVFADSGERFVWEADIERSLWRKLLINCAINPLTAVHRCRNGALLAEPELRRQAETICAELAAVASARGYADLAAQARVDAFAVMESTAGNNSSMLQDRQHGRQTEIEYITGYLCREAERLGVPCPGNRDLLEQVRQFDSEAAPT